MRWPWRLRGNRPRTRPYLSTEQALVGTALTIPPIHKCPVAGDGANARHSYKSELVLLRDPDLGTKKILWWYDKDPRPLPHNHPWDFRSAKSCTAVTLEEAAKLTGIDEGGAKAFGNSDVPSR